LRLRSSEHRLHRVCCPGCGRTVRAELPAGVPRGCFGPKLEAAIAALTVRNRLSRRQLVELIEELFACLAQKARPKLVRYRADLTGNLMLG
jgi:transposase